MKWLFPTTLALICAASVFAEAPINLTKEDPEDPDNGLAEINIFPIGECDGPFSKSVTFPTDVCLQGGLAVDCAAGEDEEGNDATTLTIYQCGKGEGCDQPAETCNPLWQCDEGQCCPLPLGFRNIMAKAAAEKQNSLLVTMWEVLSTPTSRLRPVNMAYSPYVEVVQCPLPDAFKKPNMNRMDF